MLNDKRSYTEYTVTQPTTDFAIGFEDYAEGSKDNIVVSINGILAEALGYAVLRKNSSEITITPAVATGTVRLQRETAIDEPFHQFTAGALFSAKSMDENLAQVRHSQQEVRDGFVFLEYNTNGIVQASKEATALAKAATVEATASARTAEAVADTAVQAVGSLQGVVNAATTATTKANTATATANTAASQATSATTSAQNATQAANTAKQEAAAAAANANAVTIDTLAATNRANDAAVVVEGLTTTINNRVSAVEVSQDATIERVDNFIATDVVPIVNDAISNMGFVTVDSFELGATITQRNQALRHAATGKLYRWAGNLPKVVPASSTPTNSGGIGANAWLEVSDTVLRQELNTASGGFLVGGVPIIVETMSALKTSERIPSRTYLLKAFYSDFEGVETLYEWKPSYNKIWHNGGTIIDPTHPSVPATTEWWVAKNSGATGCFVMVSADNKHLDVRWFGARNDTDMFAPDFDSWDAFDAAFRTCFWNHSKAKKSVNGLRRILTPLLSTDNYDGVKYRGYYVSKRITDEAKGFPLAAKGVQWTALDVAAAQNAMGRVVVFDGIQIPSKANVPAGVMKNPNDYLYRFKWILTEFYNIAVTGNPTLKDQYPVILNNQKTMGDRIFLRACGGDDYAMLEGLTVESGLVPYQIYPQVVDRIAGTFNIGVIVDNGATGTQSDTVVGAISSNCNLSSITNITTVYCTGTTLYLSRAETSTADTNGCYFHFANAQGSKKAAILTINGGSSNKAYIQCAQTNFAAVHLIGSGAGPSRNNFEVGYMGDFANGNDQVAYLFIDDRVGGSNITDNVLTTTGTNYTNNHSALRGRWLQIHPLSLSQDIILRRNAVKTQAQAGIGGAYSEVTSGFGSVASLPAQYNASSLFTGKKGELISTGVYKNTVTLSDIVGGVDLGVVGDLMLRVDIMIAAGAGYTDQVAGSWICSANVNNAPVAFKISEPTNTATSIISDAYISAGKLVWDITAPSASSTKCYVTVKNQFN